MKSYPAIFAATCAASPVTINIAVLGVRSQAACFVTFAVIKPHNGLIL